MEMTYKFDLGHKKMLCFSVRDPISDDQLFLFVTDRTATVTDTYKSSSCPFLFLFLGFPILSK